MLPPTRSGILDLRYRFIEIPRWAPREWSGHLKSRTANSDAPDVSRKNKTNNIIGAYS